MRLRILVSQEKGYRI